MLCLTVMNSVVYVTLTTVLRKFFQKYYNNRFDSQIKPIVQICYLLLLQSLAMCANQALLYYYTEVKTSDDTRVLLLQIEETIVPYFSILFPSGLIFYQHIQVFKKEEKGTDHHHDTIVSQRANSYASYQVDDDEPDLTAEFDHTLERYDGINMSTEDLEHDDSLEVEQTERDETLV